MKNLLSLIPAWNKAWGRFGLVGIAATCVYVVLAFACQHTGMPLLVGNTIAYAAGFVVSYLGHMYWTFASTANHRATLPKFLLTQLIGLGLNSVILWTMIRAGIAYTISLVTATVSVPVVVYLISKHWVFINKTPPAPPPQKG